MTALLLILAALAGVFVGGVVMAFAAGARRAEECAECRRRTDRQWRMWDEQGEWRDGTE